MNIYRSRSRRPGEALPGSARAAGRYRSIPAARRADVLLHFPYNPIRRITTREGDTEFSDAAHPPPSLLVLLLALPAAAWAIRSLPRRRHAGRRQRPRPGRSSTRAAGSSAASTRVASSSRTPPLATARGPIVYGAERIRDLGNGTARCTCGEDVRFRMIGGLYRVTIQAVGIDVSAVGRGTVVLDATGFTDLPGPLLDQRRPVPAAAGQADDLPARPAASRPRSGSERAERPSEPDRARGRGRELDRVVRRALPQERRLRRPHRRDRQRGARAVPGVAARADRARPDAARTSTGSRSAGGSARARTCRS